MAAQSAQADTSRLSLGARSRRGPAVALYELHICCVGRLAGQLHPKAFALGLQHHLWESKCLPTPAQCFANRTECASAFSYYF